MKAVTLKPSRPFLHARRWPCGPPGGIWNVTEWAKKQACWDRVQRIIVEWPKGFLDELISLEEQKGRKRDGEMDQKLLNGIEAQTAVVECRR